MKVESTFVIDGQMVKKVEENPIFNIYESKNMDVIYITLRETGEVITKIDLECDMGQGCGYIASTTYTSMQDK